MKRKQDIELPCPVCLPLDGAEWAIAQQQGATPLCEDHAADRAEWRADFDQDWPAEYWAGPEQASE